MVELVYDDVDVTLVLWPAEAAVRAELAAAGRRRVLLVAGAAEAPDVRDPLEDWLRVPADHRDVDVRARRLARCLLAPHPGVELAARI